MLRIRNYTNLLHKSNIKKKIWKKKNGLNFIRFLGDRKIGSIEFFKERSLFYIPHKEMMRNTQLTHVI